MCRRYKRALFNKLFCSSAIDLLDVHIEVGSSFETTTIHVSEFAIINNIEL